MKQFYVTLSFLIIFTFSCSSVSFSQDEQLVWQDEFDGDMLDTTKWLFRTGAHGWGNAEWQNYTNGENVRVKDGILYIIAERTGEGQKAGDYSSARLNSIHSFTYGRMEVRAKVPDWKGPGLWPAIWMLGKNIREVGWPLCGEIDIMEYVSYDPGMVHQTIHSAANNHMKGTHISSGPRPLETIEESFHLYGLIWSEHSLIFYIDDTDNVLLEMKKPERATAENWPFDQPFYFILNLAVGGNWGGKNGVADINFPAVMEVDYVRVYQSNN